MPVAGSVSAIVWEAGGDVWEACGERTVRGKRNCLSASLLREPRREIVDVLWTTHLTVALL